MPRVTGEALCKPGWSWNPETVADAAVLHARVARADGPRPRVGGQCTVFASWWGGWATPARPARPMHSGSPTLVMVRNGEHELFRRQIMPTTGTGPAGPRSATQAQARTSVNRAEPCGTTLGTRGECR